MDGSISYETGRWVFQFNGRNLTDKVYVTRMGGSILAIWGNPGRTWVLSARVKL
jgi:outer membrane receptor protein involved in Fe transport